MKLTSAAQLKILAKGEAEGKLNDAQPKVIHQHRLVTQKNIGQRYTTEKN